MRRKPVDDRQLGLFELPVPAALETLGEPKPKPEVPKPPEKPKPEVIPEKPEPEVPKPEVPKPEVPKEPLPKPEVPKPKAESELTAVHGERNQEPSSLSGAADAQRPAAKSKGPGDLGSAFSEATLAAPEPVRLAEVRFAASAAQGARLRDFRETAPAPSVAEALRLNRNLALMAGAGTGKTHSLITLSLHLLGGARNADPIPPHALGLLTFTDKAAAEMRERLYARLDALARGTATEPELGESFQAVGKDFPKPSAWRQIRDALGSAPIGTFHALCVQLLRDAPPGRAVSPGFELLDDLDARALLSDTADRVVLAALERGDPHVSDLAREWGLGGTFGLAASIIGVLKRIREEGQTADALAVSDPHAANALFAAQLSRCEEELARAEVEAAKGLRPERRVIVSEVRRHLTGLTLADAGERLGRMAAAWGTSRAFPDLRKALFGDGLIRVAAGVKVIPYERAFRRLLGEVATAYDSALRQRNALDFTALLIEARDLLRDDLNARRLAQGRFQALLVDELQDTNRLQLELLHLLAEKREGAPRPTTAALLEGSDPVLSLPLEPAFLCVVGDRKQSIYEFRGADVSVVEQAARAIDASGGTRAFLKTSRRSCPALVSFFNRVFPKLMVDPRTQQLAPLPSAEGEVLPPPPTARSFDVSYVPAHDDLLAHREQTSAEPAVERYINTVSKPTADELRYIDARALARRVRELIESKRWRGGDIALLFRRFTFVEEYRQALLAEGIPHRLVRGRGFYGAQEVMDLAAFLSVVADASDATALAVCLRSPLVGVSDASLVRIARATGGRLDARKAIALAEIPAELAELERSRLQQFQSLVRRLRAERHRLGLRPMLRAVLDETRYLEAMAATAFGAQILANVEKLLELAARRDSEGPADCGAFARELAELADANPLEAHADVIDDDDPDAVTLCTIHQAKGLEWPVVVLPELFSPLAPTGARARYERDMGLALKTIEPDLDDPPRFEKAKAERKAREEADFKRVRYVAMTRARDMLVLGVTKKGAAWADLDEACLGVPEVLERPLQLPELLPPMERASSAADAAALEEARARLATRPAPKPRRALLPVTQLQDFALCPTRYRLLHLAGLSEYPAEPRALELEPSAPVADVRERGTHAHKLLEHVRYGVANDLAALEREHGLPEDLEVRSWVERFLATDFARGLKDVHRELPFVLRLEHDGFTLHLRGAIDLLVMGSDGSATIVDYKSSLRPAGGLDAYRFQLGCYVLAARALLGPDVPIRAGISFLREQDPTPELLPPGIPVDEAWLAGQAHALVTAQVDGRWQAQPEARCRALKCGYVYRCHPTGGLL